MSRRAFISVAVVALLLLVLLTFAQPAHADETPEIELCNGIPCPAEYTEESSSSSSSDSTDVVEPDSSSDSPSPSPSPSPVTCLVNGCRVCDTQNAQVCVQCREAYELENDKCASRGDGVVGTASLVSAAVCALVSLVVATA